MMKNKVYAVSGIDTDVGKTIATGLLARSCRENGMRVITQKMVQTGCTGISEDIIRHREIMQMELQPVDLAGVTCPYVFPVPCSPHLAARLENSTIDCNILRKATALLLEEYELVFLEGAGGLFVPLTEDYALIDYLAEENHPLILVSSSQLGSINHTLSALSLAKSRNLDVVALIYNRLKGSDGRIEADSKEMFSKYMKEFGFSGSVIDLFPLEQYQNGQRKMNLPDFQG